MSETMPKSRYAGAARFADVVHVELDDLDWLKTHVPVAHSTLFILNQYDRYVGQIFVHRDDPLREAKIETLRRAVEHVSMPKTCTRAQTVSLIICTRDRPKELRRCLASLSYQTRQPDEVIVVDNASADEAAIKEIVEDAGFKYQRENRPGLDFARNTGMATAQSDILAFVDDDTRQRSDWLQKIVEAFDRKDIYAVTGLILPAELSSEAQYIFEKHWSFGRGFSRRDYTPTWFQSYRLNPAPVWTIGAGANMAFRREARDEIGWFDERLGAGAAGCGDDSEYWNRILSAGKICRYEPSAVNFHYHRSDLEELQKQIRAYMSGHVCALLVQWQRHGTIGNLCRVLVSLPLHLGRRWLGRKLRGKRHDNALIKEEIAGAIEGARYFLRTRHDTAPDGRMRSAI